jgi:hypothetical protein
VHVDLGRRQILVPGQLLDSLRRRPAHREVGAERVPQQMHAGVRQPGLPRGPLDQPLDDFLRQRLAIVLADDPRAAQVCMDPQSLR